MNHRRGLQRPLPVFIGRLHHTMNLEISEDCGELLPSVLLPIVPLDARKKDVTTKDSEKESEASGSAVLSMELDGKSDSNNERDEDGYTQYIPYTNYVYGNSLISMIPNFFSQEEARVWIAYGQSLSFNRCANPATTYTAPRYQHRVNFNAPLIANAIFKRLQSFIPPMMENMEALTCSPNIRIYAYEKGDYFGKHIDESSEYNRTDCGLKGDGVCYSKITVLIYLTFPDDSKKRRLQGGETVFYGEQISSHSSTSNKKAKGKKKSKREAEYEEVEILSISPSGYPGACLLHGHGDNCLTHEAKPVIQGTKYVLRTDVLYG